MRCSNGACGLEGEGKFCPECGSLMMEEKITEMVLICNGSEGTCKAEIVPKQKFCMECGTKVDQSRFYKRKNVCRECKQELKPESKFCPECGTPRIVPPGVPEQKTKEEVKTNTSIPLGKSQVRNTQENNETKFESSGHISALFRPNNNGDNEENKKSDEVTHKLTDEKEDDHTSDSEKLEIIVGPANNEKGSSVLNLEDQDHDTEFVDAPESQTYGNEPESNKSKSDSSSNKKQTSVKIENEEKSSENFNQEKSEGSEIPICESKNELVHEDTNTKSVVDETRDFTKRTKTTGKTQQDTEETQGYKKTTPAGTKENAKSIKHGNENNGAQGTDVDLPVKTEENPKSNSSKDKNKTENQNKKPSGPRQSKAVNQSSEGNVIQLRFHAIIGEDLNFDPMKHKLCIRLSDNWNDLTRICEEKRKIKANEYEMGLEIKLPERAIANLQYKYCIIKYNKKDKKNHCTWEYYEKSGYSPESQNRTLTETDNLRQTAVLDQYDGIIKEHEPSRIARWWDWKSKMLGHAKYGVDIFCTGILQAKEAKSMTWCFNQLTLLLGCYKKIYYYDGKFMDNESDFNKQIVESAIRKIVDLTESRIQKIEQRKHEHKVSIALLAILLIGKFELVVEGQDLFFTLFKYLIMIPDKEKKQCFELDILDKCFPETRNTFKTIFVNLVHNIAKSSKNPVWMILMPWIHLLCGMCAPYETPPLDVRHDDKDPVWWGISGVQDSISYFKGRTEVWHIPIEEMLNLLEPMFELDYFLPRTFIAALKLKELATVLNRGNVATEVYIAALIYYTKTSKPRTPSSSYVTTDESNVVECMNSLMKLVAGRSSLQRKRDTTDQDEMACQLSSKLFEVCASTNLQDAIRCSAFVMLYCLSVHEWTINRYNDYILPVLDESCRKMLSWMDDYNSKWTNSDMENNLLIWNGMFVNQEGISEQICTYWNTQISRGLEDHLEREVCSKAWMMKNYVQLYCQRVNKFNPPMQAVLNTTAFRAIEKGYALNYSAMKQHEVEKFGGLLSQMFLREWNEQIKNKKANHDKLQHLLKWSPFSEFLKIYAREDEEQLHLLSEDCKYHIIKAVSIVDHYINLMLQGEINIETLNLMQAADVNFPEIAELSKPKEQYSQMFIRKAIQIRCKEMDAFRNRAKLMTTFSSLCQYLTKVDKKSVVEILKIEANITMYGLKDLCIPAEVNSVDSTDNFQPRVLAFGVSETVLAILPELDKCSESNVFRKIWKKRCDEIINECLSMDDVVHKVWQPTSERWNTIGAQIMSGDITFVDFEKTVGKVYKVNYSAMADDLKKMHIGEDQIDACLNQLKKYRLLDRCTAGAKAIHKLAKEFNLRGDFSQIKLIAEHEETNVSMRSFDDSVMNTCDFLMDITEERIKCLDVFAICKPLVQWLKESMKESGLKELKVFVDLAFMSAGDEPINIARVQCVHSAVTGFAPLIFELKETAGYTDLLKLCSNVWKEVETDPELPQKLFDTNRHLEWLKEIKKAHGSVEVTSLMQAEAINESGTYSLGKTVWKRAGQDQRSDRSTLMISDVLSLRVLEKKETIQKGRYSFTQLQDLQSRLMLVAGQSDNTTDSVDLFTSVFDSLTRFSNVYIKLWSSGCLLFRDFSATFRCSTKQPVCISFVFGEGQQSPELKGRRSTGEDLKEMIPEVARFMENCLEQWLNHFKEKRKQFLHLNYFTVDQLVILQRELVKIGIEEPVHFIYPMLSAVKENCSKDDLIKAMKAAKDEIKGNNAERFAEVAEVAKAVVESRTSKVDELDKDQKSFIESMLEHNFSEELALRALNYVDATNIEDGLDWCCEHDEDEAADQSQDVPVNEPQEKQSLEKDAFTTWSESASDMETLIRRHFAAMETRDEVGSKPLMSKLELLWKMFLESISSNIRDYLSLEHLGIILKHLASTNSKKVSRALPDGFKEGQLNLILCPSADVLFITLTIYLNQPLPFADEVLMCTPNTTKDEVDIFWRRALFDGQKKIHCLVNADLLGYDVSEDAQRNLEEYLLEISKDATYRLIVLCGSDNEYKSGMVSSLDKYKRPTLSSNVLHLKEYLSKKLQIPDDIGTIKPAASVDKYRSSVRVIKSKRAGVGKSLFKKRREEDVSSLNTNMVVRRHAVTIPLQEKTIDLHYVIEKLLEHTLQPNEDAARLFHIDVSHEVQNGVDFLLFNLLVLGCLMDKTGYVWRKSPYDLYLIETLPLMADSSKGDKAQQYFDSMLAILPDLICRSPQECLDIYHENKPQDFKDLDQLFDKKQFESPVFQRPFQYLIRLDEGRSLTDVNPNRTEGSPKICLTTLLKHCGLKDPSWSELHHFVWFLNTQLEDYKKNMFVSAAAEADLPGFAKFVLLFLIQMSKDFSTRSLDMSEESPELNRQRSDTDEMQPLEKQDNLQTYEMRRTWESSPHPYLFFNTDGFTFTFLGFNIDRITGNLIDLQTKQILEKGIMKKELFDALIRNKVDLQENFDALSRAEKIQKLCNVMGITTPLDPDDTYELTTDNVKKIMAIYMRFRCDIPVIIMGETGCGKTRLIKFMCELQFPAKSNVTNMILMKVHGGTTDKDIIEKVKEAEKIAVENTKRHGKHLFTVLFFDEANTTEAIGLIKEIMCDKSVKGEKLDLCENFKMVAACNPYRKHSDELIKKLEKAGLGYHVDADETTDRFGRVPMRRLVYRVQPLPQSLLPLVWDFGQLNTKVEELYIRQMVRRYVREEKLPDIPELNEVLSAILTASQDYMREQKDECSFVSLRDVDRVLTVMNWFYKQSQDKRLLFKMIDRKIRQTKAEKMETAEDSSEPVLEQIDSVDDVTRSLILAIGVCYHACLKTRSEYRSYIAKYFKAPCELPGGADQIKEEIDCCQQVFLDNVHLDKNIARNMALKENLFMMVVCIELRIPLFLVGKPGSSKSLAKTIVSDAMQGNSSKDELFKKLKQVQMVSFQCSPLSTPDGIVGTFRQCAQFQEGKDLDSFVSVVVLDEVGLAEDSPKMPLKTLHPLLEDGCQGNEKPEKYKKVGFIGISNWALDPAKMNRGILVQREKPDLTELKNSASGICSTDEELTDLIEHFIEPMAKSYLQIFDEASTNMREFYGLRDFYSLVKMVYAFVEKSNRTPTWNEMQHAIRRNFGGLEIVEPETIFREHLKDIVSLVDQAEEQMEDLKDIPPEKRKAAIQKKMDDIIKQIKDGTKEMEDINKKKEMCSNNPAKDDQDSIDKNLEQKTIKLKELQQKLHKYQKLYDELDNSPSGLIQACLFGAKNESRYLLLLLENYGALTIVQQKIFSNKQSRDIRPITIFGSSFRSDQEYTQVCRNINKIKVCMETGNTVVLLNLEKLYESLYDALNQYYVYFGGERYVDIGLGTHRVKCPVHKNFRLIVIAEKRTVYKKFPIPLINRLEKHFLTINTMLTPGQQIFAEELKEWVRKFITQRLSLHLRRQEKSQVKIGDVFIGYHDDACSAIVLSVCERYQQIEKEILNEAKYDILQCATPESLFRLKNGTLPSQEQDVLQRWYFEKQKHDSLIQFLTNYKEKGSENLLRVQVTTHSKLMASVHKKEIGTAVDVSTERILLLETLSSFETEQQFTKRIKDHIMKNKKDPSLMVIQCDSGEVNANLVACARYCVRDELQKMKEEPPIHVIFIVQLTRGTNFNGFQCGVWQSIHIDDLYPDDVNMPTLHDMNGKSVADIFRNAVSTPMIETEETDKIKRVLSVKGLILKCVQGALSVVRNKDGNTVREMQRVALVRKLLHQENAEGQNSFIQGICGLLCKILQDIETKKNSPVIAKNWMVTEAAVFDNITKAGTFRRSCLQVLEGKVTPILAEIIAYLDTNENLSILEESVCPWKQDLWLSVLNRIEPHILQNKDIMTPTKRGNLQEVEVMTTGCEGQMFSARMPFSWVIMQKIRDIFEIDYSKEGSFEPEVKVLANDEIGSLLASMKDKQSVEESVQEYIEDFVHTVYYAASANEHKLVAQFLHKDVNRRLQEDSTHYSLLHRIVHVHITYQTYAKRLNCFRSINSVWTNCSSEIMEVQQNPKTPKDHYIFKEDFTFSALKLLMERLTPTITHLNTPERRAEWSEKVHRCRPVVEKIISIYTENLLVSYELVYEARKMWSNILVIKLCLEHLFTALMKEKFITSRCTSFWIKLQKTDLKESLRDIEEFLEKYNQNAMKETGFSGQCTQCERELDGPPNSLPCKEIVCDQCADELHSNQTQKCRKCNVDFPDGWEPLRQTDNQDALREMQDSQKRCNTFFMEVVSQLCFVDNTAPSKEVVQKLLSYVFFTTTENKRTRQFTIFKTGKGLDPNPVFRSFLLQLLARSSEDDLRENLKTYLDKAEDYMKEDEKGSQYVELGVLVIQCLEDMFTLKAAKTDAGDVLFATEALETAKSSVRDNDLFVEKMYGIANARVGLAVLAKALANLVDEKDTLPKDKGLLQKSRTEIDKLSQTAKQLFEGTGDDTIIHHVRTYLVKVMCRTYGVHIYQALCQIQNPAFEWINITDIKKIVEVPDRYVVCGKSYTNVRESVSAVAIGADIAVLEKTIEKMQDLKGRNIELVLQLAIHREVTSSHLYPEEKRKVVPQTIKHLQSFIDNSDVVQDKQFLQALLQNDLVPRQLVVQEGADLRHQGIQCLVIHFMAAMANIEVDHTLLQPLKLLMVNPGACGEMFLPTMPQDDLEELKAILSLQQTNYGEQLDKYTPLGGGEQIVFYRCPNGHPYSIGNCGRAYTVGKCYKCGADIGGTSHKLIETNVKDAEAGAVKEKGHVLGSACNRIRGPDAERTMNPPTCAILRLFVHLPMYIGARNNGLDLKSIISPAIGNIPVEDFVWSHIEQDIVDIKKALERSEDDVLLLMHTVIVAITNKYTQSDKASKEVCQLTTKIERQKWEEEFFTSFLQEPLGTMEILLQTHNKMLADDKRLGGDPLLQLLYEVDSENENASVTLLQNNPKVWRFSTPISIASLRQEVMSLPKDRHTVLQLFLQEEHHLRALRYIPSILRLHRILINKYQRKLDKDEASQITAAQLISDSHSGDEIKRLIIDFGEAWELVRNSLKHHTCVTDNGFVVVSEEFCQKTIDDTTPISVLLPTTKEKGLCSYALLHFLFMKQNDVLDRYLNGTGRSPSSIATVSPKDVTSAHLISYDPQHDIKPLLLANCQYSFEVGKGTKVEYDIAGFERQLIDRLFYSKSKIDITKMIQIDLMVYRAEFTNAEAFKKLNEKIQQDVLSSAWKKQICSDTVSLPEICQSLYNLDITISFLTSTGGNQESSLDSFMSDTLQMETAIHSAQARQICKFRHIKSLWLLLSHQKSKLMTGSRQHTESIFETVSAELHEDIPDELKVQLQEYAMLKLSVENLSQLLEILHEYILLNVAVKQNPNDEDYTDMTNYGLRDCLVAYLQEFDEPPMALTVLNDFPGDILYKHSVHTWLYSFRHLGEKQTGKVQ